MSANTTGTGRVHVLDVLEVKQALHEAATRKAGRKPINGHYVQAEITWDESADRIIGARVWYTKEIEPGQDPEKAVRVW